MYRSRIIRSHSLLTTFAELYRCRASQKVSLSYLRAAGVVRGLFDRHGDLVGGYVVHVEGAIRSLGALAADAPLRMMPSLDDACEVSCLWFARDVPRSARLGLYARLVLDIAATGRSVVVTATCCERLARVASTFLPREVYSGAGSFGRASGHVWLLAGTPRTVLAAALRSAWSYLRRPAAECGLAQARTMLANRQA